MTKELAVQAIMGWVFAAFLLGFIVGGVVACLGMKDAEKKGSSRP